jgi:FkbM family methyltransferase
MFKIAKRIAAVLPNCVQQELKRRYCAYNIFRKRFIPDEPEYAVLDKFLSNGDWVLDIGANIGHYTLKLSNLVGSKGRVFALEPVPETFELLSANVQLFPIKNVTLLNVAVSDQSSIVSMKIPVLNTGLKNYYMASISEGDTGLDVFCMTIDSLPLSHPIRLVKIDVEGNELQVLYGMKNLLIRDKPTLIIETNSRDVIEHLLKLGYKVENYPNSPNYIFQS